MPTIPLARLAHARSGDKGSSANVGVVAHTAEGYVVLCRELTAARVADYFRPLGHHGVERFEMPNLEALNFLLHGVLGEGGSRSLRTDAQGKTLGQAILLLPITLSAAELARCQAKESP